MAAFASNGLPMFLQTAGAIAESHALVFYFGLRSLRPQTSDASPQRETLRVALACATRPSTPHAAKCRYEPFLARY
jgi:hypothetical protein